MEHKWEILFKRNLENLNTEFQAKSDSSKSEESDDEQKGKNSKNWKNF